MYEIRSAFLVPTSKVLIINPTCVNFRLKEFTDCICEASRGRYCLSRPKSSFYYKSKSRQETAAIDHEQEMVSVSSSSLPVSLFSHESVNHSQSDLLSWKHEKVWMAAKVPSRQLVGSTHRNTHTHTQILKRTHTETHTHTHTHQYTALACV